MTDNAELARIKTIVNQTFKGGVGSGFFGHSGRPGEVGGSSSGNITSGAQRDKNFKKWFGNSKVVDENGKPQIVYHSTKADFQIYSNGKIGSATDEGYYGKGFYFSTNPLVSSEYVADWNGEFKPGANIQPVYLRIEKPLEIYKDGKEPKLPDDIFNILPDTLYSTETGFAVSKNEIHSAVKLTHFTTPEAFTNYIKDAGYDGAYLEYGTPGHHYREYIVYESNQIKSAFNQGSFDINSPNILKELRR